MDGAIGHNFFDRRDAGLNCVTCLQGEILGFVMYEETSGKYTNDDEVKEAGIATSNNIACEVMTSLKISTVMLSIIRPPAPSPPPPYR